MLKELVLEQVKRVISYIQNFEWLFIKEQQNATIEEQKAQLTKNKKAINTMSKKIKRNRQPTSAYLRR